MDSPAFKDSTLAWYICDPRPQPSRMVLQEEMGTEMFIVSKGEIAVMRFFTEEECEDNQLAMRSHFNSISSMDHTDNKRRLSSKDSAANDRAGGKKFTYITVLTKGNVFGEISVIFDVPRICTCRAIVQSDLFTLSKEDFFTTVGAWPDEYAPPPPWGRCCSSYAYGFKYFLVAVPFALVSRGSCGATAL